jgi:hypothetical protein
MVEIIKRLYVGDDADYERLKTHEGWSFLRVCKEGAGGHRQTLVYHTLGAPKDSPNYLWIRKGHLMALNVLDLDDPKMIPELPITKGLEFLKERFDAGDKILSACNAGHSRGPTVMLLFLRAIGEMPESFPRAVRKFKTLYPAYDPGIGMRTFAREHWQQLKDNFYATEQPR